MSWNWFNTFGVIIILCILIPNILYALQKKYIENKCTNKSLNVMEQIGRYGSMILMFLNIGIDEFGFSSIEVFIIWLICIPTLLLLYWIVWFIYFKRQKTVSAMLLAIIPSMIFVMSGILLGHWLLVIFGVIFSVAHITITYKNCVIK